MRELGNQEKDVATRLSKMLRVFYLWINFFGDTFIKSLKVWQRECGLLSFSRDGGYNWLKYKEAYMALIDCPECEKKISDKAAACPHCGYPLRETRTSRELPFMAPLAEFAEILTETLREFAPRERKGERQRDKEEERRSHDAKAETGKKEKKHRPKHHGPQED
jgi:hypothetical protein